MFRRKDLCPGFSVCPYVGLEDPVPEYFADTPLPCEKCPEQYLQQYLDSPGGNLIGVVIDLDAALQAGMAITLHQLTYPEFVVLRMLLEERDRFTTEEAKRKNQR
jgi:hypothetical protein